MHKKDPSGQGFLCNMQSIHREKTKTAPKKVLFLFCIAPPKKISLSNPEGITEYLPFLGSLHSRLRLYL